MSELHSGVISRVYGAFYSVLALPDLAPEYPGKLRGKLRLKKNTPEFVHFRNLIMVGDHVEFLLTESGEALIESVESRRNEICRASPSEIQALGANVDRAFLVVSLVNPSPRWHFVDRFLASCHGGGVEASIVFTKADLLPGEKDEAEIRRLIQCYTNLGYETFALDLLKNNPPEEMQKISSCLKSGVTLLAGNSGTGKSTLLNAIFGREIQKTGILTSTGKGRHTTTNPVMFVHEKTKALVIDTPGVREWGVSHLSRREIIDSYPEMLWYAEKCRFRSCEHLPGIQGCAVQEKLQHPETKDGGPAVTEERMKSLLSILDSLENPAKIRMGDYIKPTGRMRTGKIRPRQ